MLSVVMPCVIILSVIRLNVTYMPFVLSVDMLNVTHKPIMLSDVLNVVMLSAVPPCCH